MFTRLIHAACPHAFMCIALVAAACSAPRGTPSAASSTPEQASASASAPTASAPPLDLASTVPWPSAYHDDVLWTRAARGDVIDRHALAQREGARGLLTALALGGELGRTALAALPLAPDARAAGAELCRLIASAHAPTREWLLAALHALLLPDPTLTFEPDAEANGTCRERLVALDAAGSLAASEHDLVASALVYLAPASAR
ncbi:MAG: hypothetical protein ABW217_12815 [Polyangiaceae bacterium]